MTLRAYDELVQEANITGIVPGLSTDSTIGKIISMFVANAANKALRRVLITGFVAWFAFMFLFIFPSLDGGSFFAIIPLFLGGPFIVIFGVIGGYTLLMNTLLGMPELKMTSVLLRRGDVLDIQYQQAVKRSVTLKSMSFTLILRESATYDQGTSTITETHDHVIDETVDFDISLTPATGINHQLSFTIPDDAMHTFEAYRNKLDWMLLVKLDIPNFPDFHRNYKLKVLPEVNPDES